MTTKELKEQLAELTDEATAIQNVAESLEGEGKALDADQQKRWDELMGEETGEVAVLTTRIQSAMRVDGERKRLATLRMASGSKVGNPLSGTEFDLQTGVATRMDFYKNRFKNPQGRLRWFSNDEAGRRDAIDCGIWLRAVTARSLRRCNEEAEAHVESLGWSVMAIATEGTDSAGGYLVPDPLLAAFIERRESVGIARQLAEFQVMTSDTLRVPKLISGPVITYPGEAGAGTPSDQVWGSVALAAAKRMALSQLSAELLDDSLIADVEKLVSRMGYEFALKEDTDAIKGDGTATYGGETGLLTALGAAGKFTAGTGDDTWGELALQDFTDTMAILPDEYWGEPSWLCSASFYHSVMLRIQASAGGNTIATLEAGGKARPLFLGYPVYFTGQMPKTTAAATVCALFGTFADGLLLGDRSTLSLAFSSERFFELDVTAVRGITRIDFNVHEGGDGSNAGAYVGLSTAA